MFPVDGCFSYHCCAVLLVRVTSSVVFASPKALASPTLISFRRYAALSRPYRAPFLLLLSVGCALFECLPTATKSHALRAEMPLRGPSEAAGGTPRGTSEAAGGTHRGTPSAAGGTPGGTPSAAGGTPGGMSVIMASDTPVCRGRRLPRRPCGPTITRPRCSPSCSKRRFHSSWRCSR